VVALFPLFVKLKGRKSLVVGAGAVAEGKVGGLLTTGADVWVVAPRATAKVQNWARSDKIRWLRREFRDSDLNQCFCVVAATSSNTLHKKIFRLAQQRGVLCNVVDIPDLCDFYYPAVVRRGALQIAISTAGESPALAQRLRKKLESQFGPEYAVWLKRLGKARRKLNATSVDGPEKKSQLQAMSSEDSFRAFLKTFQKKRRGRPQVKFKK
jgi:precorrin-2 dehydrogenase / sirohydrochlorin ferrochelatase